VAKLDFPPGAPVLVRVNDSSVLRGVVMKHWRKGVLVAIDESEVAACRAKGPNNPLGEFGSVAYAWPKNLTRLDGPLVRVCRRCGRPEGREVLTRKDGTEWECPLDGCEMIMDAQGGDQ
jgi:hypothetical protein